MLSCVKGTGIGITDSTFVVTELLDNLRPITLNYQHCSQVYGLISIIFLAFEIETSAANATFSELLSIGKTFMG